MPGLRHHLVQLRLCPQPGKGAVAGVDEAGRGCLAGPVVAAAVVLPHGCEIPGLDDSKALTPTQRTRVGAVVTARAVAWSLGVSWPPEIDRVNVLQASLLAMQRAVRTLRTQPGVVLVDGDATIPHLGISQRSIVNGDALVPAISAASVLAKSFRDRLMDHLEKRYPGYGFSRHKGYGTADHLQVLKTLGPSPMHRMTFKRIKTEPKELRCRLPGI